jgi:AcrR family transcriptional regulator
MTIDMAPADQTAFDLAVVDRKRIVAATVETLERLGYRRTTVEEVARTADMSVACVHRQFPDWKGLLLAALDRWNQDRFEQVARETAGGATLGFMRGLVAYSAQHPALSRTLLSLAVEGTDPGHLASLYLRDRYCDFHTMVQQGLAFDVTEGVVPAGVDVKALATTLIALFEGLQLQMLLRPGFEPTTAFDHALAEITCSW